MSRETALPFAPLRTTKNGNNWSDHARAAFVPKEEGNKRRTRARVHGIAGCDVDASRNATKARQRATKNVQTLSNKFAF